jgi:uncharacterized DUF497 family protein
MIYNRSMADIDIRELLWDGINQAHIWKHHQISRELVEEACYGDPQNIKVRATYHNRLLVIAPLQNKKLLTIILSPLAGGRYYPISAHIASIKERRAYREWKVEKSYE